VRDLLQQVSPVVLPPTERAKPSRRAPAPIIKKARGSSSR
jgi:hypothetical protein